MAKKIDPVLFASLLASEPGIRKLWDRCKEVQTLSRSAMEKKLFRETLAVLVGKSSDGKPLGYYHVGPDEQCVGLGFPLKIFQVTRWWVEILAYSKTDLRRLEELSSALGGIRKSAYDYAIPFARTIRMLLFFEALFCAKDKEIYALIWSANGNDLGRAARDLYDEALNLRQSVPRLDNAIDCLENVSLLSGFEGLGISLPLLMLVAIRYSQCEYYGSIIWEHFSAGRARDELQKSWHPLGKHADQLLDLVSLFIRYQSAPGQLARQSGSEGFRHEVRQLANRIEFGSPANADTKTKESLLLSALNVIGVVEEARNHMLPNTDSMTSVGPLRLNAGLDQSWDAMDYYKLVGDDLHIVRQEAGSGKWLPALSQLQTKLDESTDDDSIREKLAKREGVLCLVERNRQAFIDLLIKALPDAPQDPALLNRLVDQSTRTPRKAAAEVFRVKKGILCKYTWAFAGFSELSAGQFLRFKLYLEKNFRTFLPTGHGRSIESKQVTAFSLGRRQFQLLRSTLVEKIQNWDKQNDPKEREQAIRDSFHLRLISVPKSPGGQMEVDKYEYVIEVLLLDEIAVPKVLPGEIANEEGKL